MNKSRIIHHKMYFIYFDSCVLQYSLHFRVFTPKPLYRTLFCYWENQCHFFLQITYEVHSRTLLYLQWSQGEWFFLSLLLCWNWPGLPHISVCTLDVSSTTHVQYWFPFIYRTQASQITRISYLYQVHKSPVLYFTHVECAKKRRYS